MVFREVLELGKFHVQTNLSRNIGTVMLTPSVRTEVVWKRFIYLLNYWFIHRLLRSSSC